MIAVLEVREHLDEQPAPITFPHPSCETSKAGFDAGPAPGVGRHLNGRFLAAAPPARWTDHDARRPEVDARRLAANAVASSMRRSDHPSRPSAITLLSFLGTQNVGHPGGRRAAHRPRHVLAPGAALAGFQMSINGRFGVDRGQQWHRSLRRWTSSGRFLRRPPRGRAIGAGGVCGPGH